MHTAFSQQAPGPEAPPPPERQMGTEKFTAFFNNERGVTAIEYALIASLIFLAIVGAVTAMAGQAGALFDQIAAAL